MGADILLKKKGGERRFLGRIDDDDDGGKNCRSNFSVEIFNDDCTFFHDSTPAVVDPFLHDGDDQQPYTTAEDRRRLHWESQQFLLQEIVEQYHSIGSNLREEMKREIEIARESSSGCSGLRRAAVNQLRSKGFNASLSVSQWKTFHKTPAGWHEYIEVRPDTQGMGMGVGKKKQIIPIFVVEVGFRDEFRMGKASEEYKELINLLPEMYIGKWEHMKAMIRLVCDAAKKSADEQNIHMGPWRNNNFMLMKWSSALDTSRARAISSSSNQECFTARPPYTYGNNFESCLIYVHICSLLAT